MVLETERLKSISINGLDAILLLVNLTVEIVAVGAPTKQDAEDRLTTLSNRLDNVARGVSDPQMNFLMTQLAYAIIATEPTA